MVTPKTEEEARSDRETKIRDLKQRRDERSKEKRELEVKAKKKRNKGLKDRLAELDEEIATIDLEMFANQLKLDNNERDIPFRLYMQLTISTNGPDGPKDLAIERLQYNQNLGPAMQYLLGRLLKRPMNYVNNLEITSFYDTDRFWLPAELNLTARHLRINSEHCGLVMRTVGQFLHRNNRRPFETFAFEPSHVHYDADIANAAEKLIIGSIDPSFQIDTLRHRRVHFQVCPQYQDLSPLFDYWERNGAPIGTYFTADLSFLHGIFWNSLMRSRGEHTVAETPTRGCECVYNCLIFPLAYNVQLEFYITPIRDQDYISQLNLEVQPRK